MFILGSVLVVLATTGLACEHRIIKVVIIIIIIIITIIIIVNM